MLDGIEVLNKVEIMESPMWIAIVVIVFFFIFLVSLIAGAIDIFTDFLDNKKWIPGVGMIVSWVIILMMFICDKCCSEPTGKYEYQVTIDDSVSMTEFLEKYEIIEVNGKIYMIREKE
jgi:hypothetical protein